MTTLHANNFASLNADGLDNAAIYIAGGNNNAALNAPIHYAFALDVRALNDVVDDDVIQSTAINIDTAMNTITGNNICDAYLDNAGGDNDTNYDASLDDSGNFGALRCN